MCFFSVVIPCYNLEDCVLETIKCFLNQTFSDFEIICVDNGSKDKTFEILKNIPDERIKLFEIGKSNAGAARNFGLKQARGKWVLFFDGDDFCKVNFLKTAAKKLEELEPDILFVASYEFSQKHKKPRFHRKTHLFEGTDKKYSLTALPLNEIDSNDIFALVEPWTKIYKKSFLEAGGFEFQEIASSNDTAFYYKTLFKAEKISFEFTPFVVSRRQRQGSISSLAGKNWKNYFLAYKEADKAAFCYPYFEKIKRPYFERKLEALKYFFKKTGPVSRIAFFFALVNEIREMNKILDKK